MNSVQAYGMKHYHTKDCKSLAKSRKQNWNFCGGLRDRNTALNQNCSFLKEHALTTSYKNMFYQRNQGSKTVNSNLYTYASWLKGSEKKTFQMEINVSVITDISGLHSGHLHSPYSHQPLYSFLQNIQSSL